MKDTNTNTTTTTNTTNAAVADAAAGSSSSSSSWQQQQEGCRSRGSTSSAAAEAIVFCYGDSLTAGSVPLSRKDYPYAPHLEQALQQQQGEGEGGEGTLGNFGYSSVQVQQVGLPGWTTTRLLKDLPQRLQRLMMMTTTKDSHTDGTTTTTAAAKSAASPVVLLIIIMAGTNDLGAATFATDDNGDNTGANQIVENILEMHRMCHNHYHNNHCNDSGVIPMIHTLAVGIPPSDFQQTDARVATVARQVNTQLERYCACHVSNHQATYVPFPLEYSNTNGNWSFDGLHLSKQGYRVLGERLAPTVAQILLLLHQKQQQQQH